VAEGRFDALIEIADIDFAQFLRDYFYAGGEGPIPVEMLQNQKYRDILSIRLYYDWNTYVTLSDPSCSC
jgi:hypothetical protein